MIVANWNSVSDKDRNITADPSVAIIIAAGTQRQNEKNNEK